MKWSSFLADFTSTVTMVHRSLCQKTNPTGILTALICCSTAATFVLVCSALRGGVSQEEVIRDQLTSLYPWNDNTTIQSSFSHGFQTGVRLPNSTWQESSRMHADANIPTLEDILNRFPWVQRRRFTPNHFTFSRRGKGSPPNSYRNHSIVFLHNHKAGGTTMKLCLKRIIQAKSLPPFYGLWNDNVVQAIETARTLEKRAKLYVTPYAFGLCDAVDDPYCAYFTVLRDPYDRVVSSYEYCKKSRMDPHCAASDARKLTLKEWALHQGSYFFRQLQFNPEEICSDQTRRKKVVKLVDRDNYIGRKKNRPPCWYRHKLLLDNVLNKNEKHILLQYMLENLEKWFAVIGITEQYDTSLRLLQTVFKLPFYRLCSGLVEQATTYSREKQTKWSKLEAIKKARQKIEDDQEVFEALYFDIMIYRKAVEIFNSQKRFYFQDVMSGFHKTRQ
ncbi:uncharacterized protein [Ptychodera flava]|uniref:uncharacterized protein n=1 Tax=Ptychodera flava TaxID=63121 RepID=UPI00396A97EA